MYLLTALISGALFGAGLFISGMTDTSKVQGWLDVFGAWDPTLAFVMGGAMIPMIIAWIITGRMTSALNGAQFPPKNTSRADPKLITGSVLFGAGWALAGLCPGPSSASLSYGGPMHWTFVAAMLVGMLFAPMVTSRLFKNA